jgi:hypothetical protein
VVVLLPNRLRAVVFVKFNVTQQRVCACVHSVIVLGCFGKWEGVDLEGLVTDSFLIGKVDPPAEYGVLNHLMEGK